MLRRAAIAADGRAVERGVVRLGKSERGVHCKIGQMRDGSRYFRQFGRAAQIAHHNLRQYITAQQPQLPRQFGLIRRCRDVCPRREGGQILRLQRLREHGLQTCNIDLPAIQLARQPKGKTAGVGNHIGRHGGPCVRRVVSRIKMAMLRPWRTACTPGG